MTTTLPNGIRVKGDLSALSAKLERQAAELRHLHLSRSEEEAIILQLLMDEVE